MKENSISKPAPTPLEKKMTPAEIRARFDQDVERFSNLETGQRVSLDARIILDIVSTAASGRLHPGDRLLDIGCGAGNFTLRVLQGRHPLDCSLIDLSQAMLNRAVERIRAAGNPSVTARQVDVREAQFAENSFDCIVAATVLHHLREEHEWIAVFQNLHRWLKSGGRLFVTDLTFFDAPDIQALMWNRYGQFLESVGGPACREEVFAYIDREDSPRSLPFQFEMLRRAGFSSFDVLHRNSVGACYYAEK